MKVIFLDFDGVLNSQHYTENNLGNGAGLAFAHSQLDPEAVQRLNGIIDATGARIVISSSWRHIWSREEIARTLVKRGFKHPDSIIGVTPSLLSQRGDEIMQWLGTADEKRRIGGENIDGFVILDDTDDFQQPELRDRFVQTNEEVGLTDDDVRKAISVLGM